MTVMNDNVNRMLNYADQAVAEALLTLAHDSYSDPEKVKREFIRLAKITRKSAQWIDDWWTAWIGLVEEIKLTKEKETN